MSSPKLAESQPLLNASHTPIPYNSADSPSPALEVPQQLNSVSRIDFFWILVGVWSAVFLSAVDSTVVATLILSIGSGFNKAEQASYIGTSYLLSACCFTPLYGRLSDILGRKGAMLLALGLFGTGTIACSLAPSMETLILARVIAGMGGGGTIIVTSIALSDLVPLNQRGLYQAMTATLGGLGASLGGPIGGWINDTWGWRVAFLSQAPLLLISFVLVLFKVNIKLPEAVANEGIYAKLGRIDFLGSFTLVVSVASILSAFSIKTTEELPWSHPLIWGLFVLTVAFALAFIYVETRWVRYPVMPLRLISKRTLLAIILAYCMSTMNAFSMIYNVPLYFSTVRLTSSTDAGLHLLPHSIALPLGSFFVGWWIRRTGKVRNATLYSAALCVLASVLVAAWNDKSSALHLWLDIVPQGFGYASLANSLLVAMIASVEKQDIAVATGTSYLFRTTGQVLGVSLSAVILQGVLLQQLRKRITGPGSFEIIEDIRHSINSIAELTPPLRKAATDSYAASLRVVFIAQVAINVLVFITCMVIEENPLVCVFNQLCVHSCTATYVKCVSQINWKDAYQRRRENDGLEQ